VGSQYLIEPEATALLFETAVAGFGLPHAFRLDKLNKLDRV